VVAFEEAPIEFSAVQDARWWRCRNACLDLRHTLPGVSGPSDAIEDVLDEGLRPFGATLNARITALDVVFVTGVNTHPHVGTTEDLHRWTAASASACATALTAARLAAFTAAASASVTALATAFTALATPIGLHRRVLDARINRHGATVTDQYDNISRVDFGISTATDQQAHSEHHV
jgi:hypothetical protein